MTLWEIIGSGGAGLVVLLTLIQIVPVKVNPWSSIARAIGKAINGDSIEPIIEHVTALETKVDELEKQTQAATEKLALSQQKIEESLATAKRVRILRFGDELQRGILHSKEHFSQILTDITEYERYCAAHPEYPNEKATVTCKVIMENYADRLQKNDFT